MFYVLAAIVSVNAAQGFCFVDMRINAPHPVTMHIQFGSWASQGLSAEGNHIVNICKGYKKYCVGLSIYTNDICTESDMSSLPTCTISSKRLPICEVVLGT